MLYKTYVVPDICRACPKHCLVVLGKPMSPGKPRFHPPLPFALCVWWPRSQRPESRGNLRWQGVPTRNASRKHCSPGLWEMESTSVIQQKGQAPKTNPLYKGGDSQKYHSGDKPLDPTTLQLVACLAHFPPAVGVCFFE